MNLFPKSRTKSERVGRSKYGETSISGGSAFLRQGLLEGLRVAVRRGLDGMRNTGTTLTTFSFTRSPERIAFAAFPGELSIQRQFVLEGRRVRPIFHKNHSPENYFIHVRYNNIHSIIARGGGHRNLLISHSRNPGSRDHSAQLAGRSTGSSGRHHRWRYPSARYRFQCEHGSCSGNGRS